MKITFIRHSCFFVEMETCCLLFDWYEGDIPKTDKPLYVFASHSHRDHFSPDLFHLPRQAETFYLLSADIPEAQVPEEARSRVTFVVPHQSYETGPLNIETLESTDLGVAFLICCEGKVLYHAGDLNCWVWSGASPLQNDMARDCCRQELALLAGRNIDAAFVPLDPRQEEDYDQGMKYFFQAAGAKAVFPMHMWDDYSVVPKFKNDPANGKYAPCVMDVSRPGQVFQIN